MKNIFFIVIACIYPVVSFSAIDERKTDVYFANGIKTEDWQAETNAGLLEASIKNITYGRNINEYNKHIGEVSYAYNQTANFGADSLETLLQKFGWDWLTNLFFSFPLSKWECIPACKVIR
jgi:hypothetical protein